MITNICFVHLVQYEWRNKTPSEVMLIRIPYKDSDGCIKIFRLIRRVQRQWRKIAKCLLQISDNAVRLLEKTYNKYPDEFDICMHIFRDWLANKSGEHPRTWGELIRVLKEIEMSKIAGDIDHALKG